MLRQISRNVIRRRLPMRELSTVTPKQNDPASSNFPDFVEHWSPKVFKQVGFGMSAGAIGLMGVYGICQETIAISGFVGAYLFIGYRDMNQKSHSLLRNFPFLGNARFLFESIRPEIRQYFVEADEDGKVVLSSLSSLL